MRNDTRGWLLHKGGIRWPGNDPTKVIHSAVTLGLERRERAAALDRGSLRRAEWGKSHSMKWREVGMRVREWSMVVAAGFAGALYVAAQTAPNPAEKPAARHFKWPEGKRAAVSLSFDDSRLSQIDAGLAVLRKEGVKATFYVQAPGVEKR